MEVIGKNKKPRWLPCEHTLYEHCVARLQGQTCPVCREPLSQNRSKGVPTNLSILQLIDVTMNKNSYFNTNLYEYCPDEIHKISHFCKDCDE